ncbi:MAG: purine-nucleoside phosphorylase [Clostridia bacterium]|nr:purine-nucleoside phosphorylase [Clostridia bacterium]MBR0303014.1 purine-nucleoside phosphorylase [Clostridia bacterium]
MATPHIEANKGDFADVVLMPGDPLRAKLVAETYLEDPVLVNQIRGILGYTGTYKGQRVSVMASGMGMPSIGIYTYELFSVYDVKAIIRIGSAGSYVPELGLGDVVLTEYAWSESAFGRVQNGSPEQIKYPSSRLNETIKAVAERIGEHPAAVPVHSTDVFYKDGPADYFKAINKEHGCACVEMESFGLFHNADALGKEAACLLTISDSFVANEEMSAADRQNSFHKMIRIALETAASYGG